MQARIIEKDDMIIINSASYRYINHLNTWIAEIPEMFMQNWILVANILFERISAIID